MMLNLNSDMEVLRNPKPFIKKWPVVNGSECTALLYMDELEVNFWLISYVAPILNFVFVSILRRNSTESSWYV